jgi:hypothetical protein
LFRTLESLDLRDDGPATSESSAAPKMRWLTACWIGIGESACLTLYFGTI